jgi:hypothetical protein
MDSKANLDFPQTPFLKLARGSSRTKKQKSREKKIWASGRGTVFGAFMLLGCHLDQAFGGLLHQASANAAIAEKSGSLRC